MSAPTSSALPTRQDLCPCKGCETARRQEATKWQAAIGRVLNLAESYAEKAQEANPFGYGEGLNENNAVSYWRVANEIRDALDGEQA